MFLCADEEEHKQNKEKIDILILQYYLYDYGWCIIQLVGPTADVGASLRTIQWRLRRKKYPGG